MSRRGLLVGGATAAAVGAAVAMVGGASPAAATDGDPLVAGSMVLDATGPTGVVAELPEAAVGLFRNTADTGDGLRAEGGGADGGAGVRGVTDTGTGVIGQAASSGWGVSGNSDTGPGVSGLSNSAEGVSGSSQTGTGVRGEGGASGVLGYSATGNGVFGVSPTGIGVSGFSDSGDAVFGNGTAGVGVHGFSDSGTGVFGHTPSGVGVSGGSETGLGVSATSVAGSAIEATSTSGLGIDVGSISGTALRCSAQNHISLVPRSGGAPTTDAISHARGDLVEDSGGNLWLCVTSGTPGKWRKLAGPATAGAFHVLPVPIRIYDSRPGTLPAVGSKTPLSSNVARALALTVNGSGLPPGAPAAMVNLLLVNAAAGSGNFTIWANGTAKPAANTMVWGGSAGRFSSLAVTALDALARCAVSSSLRTDLVVDVVGYYL